MALLVTRVAALSLSAALLPATDIDPTAAERDRMVRDQIEARGVHSPQVVRAMREVPRHKFVPPAQRASAYQDSPLPIGYGQTISQPYIVALMTELLELQRTHRVLEIGTGSGYQAAVLAKLAGQVYTIEIVPALAESARKTLAGEGIKNVIVRTGDGYQGWPDQAPFDRILLTAAPAEIPLVFYDQLKPGGRLVAPVGERLQDQQLMVIEKDEKGGIARRSIIPVRFVPMVPGAVRPDSR
jgi:protein-L-isoaspartate(D-aspartate) O-methyltransferase